jgi:Xaa-Pro aminopeptidase
MKSRRITCLALLALAIAPSARAQIYQTDFPPDELRARCARVMAAMAPDTVAVVQGAPLASGFGVPRQSNSMYYLSGIETPGAYLVLDARTKALVLYLPPRNERLERSEGKVLSAEDPDVVKRLTGADDVRSTAAMTGTWPFGEKRPAAIYAEFAPAEGYAQSR